MTVSMENLTKAIEYPDTDGLPMAESDSARIYLTYAVEALSIYFQNNSQVYVSGNLFIYYEEGNPKAVVAPDVFVVLGVENHNRRSYKVWQENNKLPDFVLEISSKSTVGEDQGTKKGLYAYLGVKEYFQYDPTADYLTPPLQGLRLIEGNYLPIPSNCYQELDKAKLEAEQAKLEAEQAKLEEQQKATKLAAKLRELGIDPEKL